MKKKVVHYREDMIAIDKEFATRYAELKSQIDNLLDMLEPMEEQLKQELIPVMETIGKKSVDSNGLIASLTKAYIKSSFDTKTFKEQRPKLYNQYLKETNVSSSLSIKVNQKVGV